METPPDNPPNLFRQRAVTALKLGVTLVGLYLVLSRFDGRAIVAYLGSVNYAWMLAGIGLMILSLFVRAYRWQVILHGVGSSIRYMRLVELYLVGSFFNAFLPSGLGGDVVRAAEAAQDVDSSIAVGSVLLDRLTGLLALFGMALAALPFRPADFPNQLTWLIGGVCLLGFVTGLAIVDGRILRWFMTHAPLPVQQVGKGFFSRLAVTIDSCGWRTVGLALLISVGFNLIQVGWWATTGKALGLPIPFFYYVLIVPIMALAILIPSIGGLGVRESLAPIMFSGAGILPEAAVAIAFLVFALERVASLLGAPVYIYTTIRDTRAQRKTNQPIKNH